MAKPTLLAVAMLVVSWLPTSVRAGAFIVQDSCRVAGASAYRVYFSVHAFDIEEGICLLTFVPQPQPPRPECTITGVNGPDLWYRGLNSDGGAWYSVSPFVRWGCIVDGSLQFDFTLPTELGACVSCCHTVRYCNIYFQVVVEREECFTCGAVQIEPRTWGDLKTHYRQ